MVKNHIIYEEMPSVFVKGKEKPVRVFAVVNLASYNRGPKTLAQVRKLFGIKVPAIEAVIIEEEEFKIVGNKVVNE
jgi:adenylate cyclase